MLHEVFVGAPREEVNLDAQQIGEQCRLVDHDIAHDFFKAGQLPDLVLVFPSTNIAHVALLNELRHGNAHRDEELRCPVDSHSVLANILVLRLLLVCLDENWDRLADD